MQSVFSKTYSRFTHKHRTDVVDVIDETTRSGTRRVLRCEARTMKTLLDELPPKNIQPSLSVDIASPYEILRLHRTAIQKLVWAHSSQFPIYGSFAYSCSCGAGKTIAGISLMWKLKARTMIISSRNAIKDQWQTVIQNTYPDLLILTREGFYRRGVKLKNVNDPPDVMIFSPQYLTHGDRYTSLPYRPSLIIYDEVHSLLSEEFINVLAMPMVRVINGDWPELPYMLALSATYPPSNTKEFRHIVRMFGIPIRVSSKIVDIPVFVWDYRDHFTRIRKGSTLTGSDARGFFDMSYDAMDEYEAIEYLTQKLIDDEHIVPSASFKGIVMCNNIEPSVYCALFIHQTFKCSVLLMRSADENALYIGAEANIDELFATSPYAITLESIRDKFPNGDYREYVNDAAVIVGTIARLKEGFSVQNIVWGICTKFPYSIISRIQILGRIRRNSNDPELNAKRRVMYVCSTRAPSNVLVPRKNKTHSQFTYDFEAERLLFETERYFRI